jgi:hypothetical protein
MLNLKNSFVLLAVILLYSCPPMVVTTPIPNAPEIQGQILTNSTTPTWTWSNTAHTAYLQYKLEPLHSEFRTLPTSTESFIPEAALAEGEYTFVLRASSDNTHWSPESRFETTIDMDAVDDPELPNFNIRTTSYLMNATPYFYFQANAAEDYVYQVEKKLDSWNEYRMIYDGTLDEPSQKIFRDYDLLEGQTHIYRFTAFGSGGSLTREVRIEPFLFPIRSFSVLKPNPGDALSLQWDTRSLLAEEIELQYKLPGDEEYQILETFDPDVKEYQFDLDAEEEELSFRLLLNGAGLTTEPVERTSFIRGKAPINVSAVETGNHSVLLSWDNVTKLDVISTSIRRITLGTGASRYYNLPGLHNSHNHEGYTPGESYQFEVYYYVRGGQERESYRRHVEIDTVFIGEMDSFTIHEDSSLSWSAGDLGSNTEIVIEHKHPSQTEWQHFYTSTNPNDRVTFTNPVLPPGDYRIYPVIEEKKGTITQISNRLISNLKATSQLYSVDLDWEAPAYAEGQFTYEVYRHGSFGSNYQLIGTTTGSSFTDNDPLIKERNYYQVRLKGTNQSSSDDIFINEPPPRPIENFTVTLDHNTNAQLS